MHRLRQRRCRLERLYEQRFTFEGGTLHKVVFDVADDASVNLEQYLRADFARD